VKLVGILPVRNEDYILGLTLRAALMWCDLVIVLEHCSYDRTSEILDEVLAEEPRRLHIEVNHYSDWHEMEHRQRLLDVARFHHATHIAIIDADEILTGNLLPRIREFVEATPKGAMLQVPGYNLRHGINEYHSNGIWGNRWFSAAFPDSPRFGWAGDRFHSREPGQFQSFRPIRQGQGGVMHLWGASEKRLVAKHRLYRVTERIRWPDKPVAEIERMYSWATDGSGNKGDTPAEWEFAPAPIEWWSPYAHLLRHLDVNAEPWQDAEADRLIAEHGIDYFKGLRV
jgi:hypothetical protein